VSFVYWVYDLGCGSELDSGYVGITEDPHVRLRELRFDEGEAIGWPRTGEKGRKSRVERGPDFIISGY
jgi:hypothetical protein